MMAGEHAAPERTEWSTLARSGKQVQADTSGTGIGRLRGLCTSGHAPETLSPYCEAHSAAGEGASLEPGRCDGGHSERAKVSAGRGLGDGCEGAAPTGMAGGEVVETAPSTLHAFALLRVATVTGDIVDGQLFGRCSSKEVCGLSTFKDSRLPWALQSDERVLRQSRLQSAPSQLVRSRQPGATVEQGIGSSQGDHDSNSEAGRRGAHCTWTASLEVSTCCSGATVHEDARREDETESYVQLCCFGHKLPPSECFYCNDN
eukprot:s1308_g10.t1